MDCGSLGGHTARRMCVTDVISVTRFHSRLRMTLRCVGDAGRRWRERRKRLDEALLHYLPYPIGTLLHLRRWRKGFGDVPSLAPLLNDTLPPYLPKLSIHTYHTLICCLLIYLCIHWAPMMCLHTFMMRCFGGGETKTRWKIDWWDNQAAEQLAMLLS